MNPLILVSALFATAMAAPSGQYAPAILPAPLVQVSQGPGSTVVNQPPAQVTKQLHYGQTTYVANVHKSIIKPPTPHLPVQVPTVLKGTTQVNPAIVKTRVETQVINKPYPVERKVPQPYDVPVVHQIVKEVPQPVHVRKPYAVHVPVPVQGEPIIRHRTTAPVVNQVNHVAPVVAHGYAAAPVATAAYAPAAYAPAAYAPAAYAPAAYAGYAAAPAAVY